MTYTKVFTLALVTLLISLTYVNAAGRVLYPPWGTSIEFGTPYMTNSFVGSPPTEFTLAANLTIIDGNYCGPFEAPGQWVVVSLGPCAIKDSVRRAIDAGAAGVIVHLYERALGHHSRIPISDTEITLPVVLIIFNDFLTLSDLLQNSTVIVEISPDPSEFHALVFNTGWFITLNVFFGLVYLFLLGLVIRKFVLKVRASGFILNISFVYLAFQAVFCILMIVRWLDPLNARGFYILEVDIFIEAAPVSWAFAALLLMAFFWFEVINQFANTKVTPFLSRKLQIPFWVGTAFIVLMPIASAIVIYFTFEPFIALLAVTLVGGVVVAVFYIIVAVKVMQVLNRSRKVNVDKKSRIRSLEKSRISVIISTVFACTYPIISFSLRYTFITVNAYIGVATLLEESLFLGIIVAIQVSFMPNKSIGQSSSSNRTNANGNTNTLGPFSTSTSAQSE